MSDRYMKRGSTSLVIREFQIKATIVYFYTPIKMSTIKE